MRETANPASGTADGQTVIETIAPTVRVAALGERLRIIYIMSTYVELFPTCGTSPFLRSTARPACSPPRRLPQRDDDPHGPGNKRRDSDAIRPCRVLWHDPVNMRRLNQNDALFLASDSAHSNSNVSLIQIYDPSTAPGGRLRFKSIL
ncbi:MAG TPA: hypothetical protein VN279_13245, partial [Rhodocyclaceae bacterium]|nr:hypothetical protein [Rhodocyclaceae bacterium]